jgi:hypothetical protein
LSTAADSLVGYFAVGYASDSILDGLSVNQKLPQFIRNWIHENVPTLAQVVAQQQEEAKQQAQQLNLAQQEQEVGKTL